MAKQTNRQVGIARDGWRMKGHAGADRQSLFRTRRVVFPTVLRARTLIAPRILTRRARLSPASRAPRRPGWFVTSPQQAMATLAKGEWSWVSLIVFLTCFAELLLRAAAAACPSRKQNLTDCEQSRNERTCSNYVYTVIIK